MSYRREKITESHDEKLVFIPEIDDFTKQDPPVKYDILSQLPHNGDNPCISVGIMSGKVIHFQLDNKDYTATIDGEEIVIEGLGRYQKETLFSPKEPFKLYNVTIGINFHWEQTQTQSFYGRLKLLIDNDIIHAINIVSIEDYLCCVISSEMSGTSSLELLKAHAIISRSWLLYPILEKKASSCAVHQSVDNDTLIRYYERDAHTLFDVCADDHCQRYQGLTPTFSQTAIDAVRATEGCVLTHHGKICDARFSKSCGGVSELFSSCWSDEDYSYLTPIRDTDRLENIPNLMDETEFKKWVDNPPESFCSTTDITVLQQVMNNYDCDTPDFYRWKVEYTNEQLHDILYNKLGIDFGEIEELIPIERGPSGRLIKLQIVGSKKMLTIGKELEIRRSLSTSHLYSSAFYVEKKEGGFALCGAGWGHGVGLCQIGAAMMAHQGYKYDQILTHYYPKTTITKIY